MKKVSEIVRIDPGRPESAFSRSKEVIVAGGVIAYPTDTFYGLGADPKDPVAVKRLFEIKGRRADQPILLLISDPTLVKEWAAVVPSQAERLMQEFWPGPLTLVFKAKKEVIPEITAGTGTIGLRMPDSLLTRQLLAYLGGALTGTSANISGERNIDSAQETAVIMGSMVDLILDGGKTAGGKSSTIVEVTSERLKIIREGAIPSHAFRY